MSRYGTPASELGRLAIGGSSTSSSGEMPVSTRAMRRGHIAGSGPQGSSSRTAAAAGPSRYPGRASGTQRGAQQQRARKMTGRGRDDDSDDRGNNDSSSDDSDEEDAAALLRRQNVLAAFEVAAALDQGLQAPRELSSASPRESAQRRLADALASRFRDQADLNTLRGVLSQAEALTRVSNNFLKRYQAALSNISINVDNPSRGYSVNEGLRAFRTIATGIGQHITFYSPLRVLPDGGRSLVVLMMEMLTYVTDRDDDIYASSRAPRAQYAGGGNTGNLFREFVREHMGIMEVLLRLPVPLLRERRQAFEAIVGKVRNHGATRGDQAQFEHLLGVLHQVYQRMRTE